MLDTVEQIPQNSNAIATDGDRRIRIVLADDHRLITECLAKVLEPKFELVATVDNGRDLVAAVEQFRPAVAVVDISMPLMNGLEAGKQIIAANPETKVIYLTMHTGRAYVEQALAAGASGYVLKRAAAAELVTAIEEVMKGGTYITPLLTQDSGDTVGARGWSLTSRQTEVLQLVAQGMSAKEIAAALTISTKTVEFHKAAIMEKLALHTTGQLIRYALDRGIAQP